MGKRKPPRHIAHTKQLLPAPTTQSSFAKSHKLLLETLGVIATLLTITGFYLSYIVPRLSVSVGESLKPADPLASVFVLSNDGALPVHDVLAKCAAISAKEGSLTVVQFGENFGLTLLPDARADILSAGHKMTLPCGHAVRFHDPSRLTEAQITIVITYRPDWIPLHHIKETYPWKAEKTQDDRWIWKSVPR